MNWLYKHYTGTQTLGEVGMCKGGLRELLKGKIRQTPDDVVLINIHELGILACSRWTCWGTTELSPMYLNGAYSKSMALIT